MSHDFLLNALLQMIITYQKSQTQESQEFKDIFGYVGVGREKGGAAGWHSG